MIYRVRHETIYDYTDPVSVSHHVLRLTPRDLTGQKCLDVKISVSPEPPIPAGTHKDYFGNPVTSFTLQEPHDRLTVSAASELEVLAVEPPGFSESPAWETVRDSLPADHSNDALNAYQFVFDSTRVAASPQLADYARESFPQGRPL
ncbi:MAG: transglutaminase, partial [Bryobacterales bacterium]|nr:transglutaminase [Bryobacterales bacterium]